MSHNVLLVVNNASQWGQEGRFPPLIKWMGELFFVVLDINSPYSFWRGRESVNTPCSTFYLCHTVSVSVLVSSVSCQTYYNNPHSGCSDWRKYTNAGYNNILYSLMLTTNLGGFLKTIVSKCHEQEVYIIILLFSSNLFTSCSIQCNLQWEMLLHRSIICRQIQ